MLLENQCKKFCSFVRETTANYKIITPNMRNFFALILQKHLLLAFEIEPGPINMDNIAFENFSISSYGLFHQNRIFIFLTKSVGSIFLIVFHNVYIMNNTCMIGFDEQFCPLPINVAQQL